MQHLEAVKSILTETLGPAVKYLNADSALMGSVAELDSMAVIGVITALEEHFGITVDDDEISARHFATVGTLAKFVQQKLEA